MPRIRVDSQNFPLGTLNNGISYCNFTWSDLIWAAITVGKRERYDLLRHGRYSIFEMIFRSSLIYSNLKEDGDGNIVRSLVYDGLDPSEKGAVSYFIGLTIGKLLVEKYLNIPWLMHLDVYRSRIHADITGRTRPDLIGQDINGHWIILEAKGRSRERSETALNQAKFQSQQITEIGGERCTLNIGLLSFFNSGILQAEWHDPVQKEDSIKLDITKNDIIENYYKPFLKVIEEERDRVQRIEIRNRLFDAIYLEDADIEFGIRTNIRDIMFDYRNDIGNDVQEENNNQITIGSDGVFVRLGPSWSSVNMRVEPQSRST